MTNRPLLLALVAWLCLTAVAIVPAATPATAAELNRLDWLWSQNNAPASGIEQFQRTAQRLARMTSASASTTLAAHVSPEGHWSLANMAGEAFTAANDAELKRGFEILLPDIGARRATVILSGDSLFDRGKLVAPISKTADLALGWDDETFKVALTGGPSTPRYLAELKPNLLIELSSAAGFAEALGQLRRPLERQAIRVLRLEPGGPRTLSTSPRLDRSSGRAEIDTIDPAFLTVALASLRRQTAVIVGRVDGDALNLRPATGPDRSLSWQAVQDAARSADVDLLVLKSPSAQQPGGRNWLWQRVEVKGLETALDHATLADFFDALGSPTNRLVMSISSPSTTRTALDLQQLREATTVASATTKIGNVLSGVVAGLAGNVVHEGAVANFRSTSRQRELERRLVPFIPSAAQWLYIGLCLLGLLGLPLSWRWWNRVWPAEQPAEYPKAAGLWAARAIRSLAYAALFLPAAALASAPLMLVDIAKRWIMPATRTPSSKA